MDRQQRDQWKERIALRLYSLDREERFSARLEQIAERVDWMLEPVKYLLGVDQGEGIRETWGARVSWYLMNLYPINLPLRAMGKSLRAFAEINSSAALPEVVDDDHLDLMWHLTDTSKQQGEITLPYSTMDDLVSRMAAYKPQH